MKKIFILAIIFTALNCKAQTIVPIRSSPSDAPEKSYYKDLNNELNKYVGTWKFKKGTTSFTIVLIKILKKPFYEENFSDGIAGWYQYIENGVEKVNTLHMTDHKELLSGFKLNDNGDKIILNFHDLERPKMYARLHLSYVMNKGETQLIWNLKYIGVEYVPSGEPKALTDFRVPMKLTLTKQ
jgi:hypothetical protein